MSFAQTISLLFLILIILFIYNYYIKTSDDYNYDRLSDEEAYIKYTYNKEQDREKIINSLNKKNYDILYNLTFKNKTPRTKKEAGLDFLTLVDNDILKDAKFIKVLRELVGDNKRDRHLYINYKGTETINYQEGGSYLKHHYHIGILTTDDMIEDRYFKATYSETF
jgi:hypothetical protein